MDRLVRGMNKIYGAIKGKIFVAERGKKLKLKVTLNGVRAAK
jgi:hypothetical protein